jgi:acetolactate decarboxylase
MPSMAFKLGLYDGVCTIADAKRRGDFGLGQFAALDGELIVSGGEFYRARADGTVALADDDEQLCFTQLCFYEPATQIVLRQEMDQATFEHFLPVQFPPFNYYCAFKIEGVFAQIVPTAPPRLDKPYPTFVDAIKLRKSFLQNQVRGCVVGLFSPAFTASFGVPGFHYHFLSEDRTSAGHVTSFTISKGTMSAAHLRSVELALPNSQAYQNAALS